MLETTKQKADILADRMNKITESFASNVEMTDGMIATGDDLSDVVSSAIIEPTNMIGKADAVNLETLLQDFKYVREVLKTNADSGRRIIENITLDIMGGELVGAEKSLMIEAFASINKSIAVNMDLYLKSYKEISTILVQLDKIKDTQASINGDKPRVEKEINTVDIIKALKKLKEVEDTDS